jgi:copper oxidase (laccase) domain-containing protein
VHGNEILIAHEPQRATGYDAVITNKVNLFVAVTIADCTPVLIYDKRTHALAAIHAGWRGTAAKIVERTLNEMQKNFGTNAADCFAYIGTCISNMHLKLVMKLPSNLIIHLFILMKQNKSTILI